MGAVNAGEGFVHLDGLNGLAEGWACGVAVGARDFRDFSCLLPAEENRNQPADLTRAEIGPDG